LVEKKKGWHYTVNKGGEGISKELNSIVSCKRGKVTKLGELVVEKE